MRIRRKKWAEDELKNSVLYIDRTEDTKNKWKNIFDIDNNKNKNDFEIHIEIGMGKGKFVSSLFKEYSNNKKYSNTYIIGIDMIEAMLGLAKREIENSILDISKEERESIIKKRDGSYTNIELKEKVENINNIENFKKIRILNANAENIDKYFGKEDNKNNNYEVTEDEIELGVLFENDDLVEKEIREKIDKENAIGESYINGEMNDFNVAVTGQQSEDDNSQKYNGCIVCFADPKKERYNLNNAATADSIVVTNKYIYYSLNNLGIFRLDPYTRETTKIIENQGTIEILSIENGMMTYNANGQKYYMNNIY